jgi:hypothetical protein
MLAYHLHELEMRYKTRLILLHFAIPLFWQFSLFKSSCNVSSFRPYNLFFFMQLLAQVDLLLPLILYICPSQRVVSFCCKAQSIFYLALQCFFSDILLRLSTFLGAFTQSSKVASLIHEFARQIGSSSKKGRFCSLLNANLSFPRQANSSSIDETRHFVK